MGNSYTGKYIKDVLEGVKPQFIEMIQEGELVKSSTKYK
jgi:hypothetical protein